MIELLFFLFTGRLIFKVLFLAFSLFELLPPLKLFLLSLAELLLLPDHRLHLSLDFGVHLFVRDLIFL
jgi:hypothetical protein